VSYCFRRGTHRLAIPAFLTAVEMALTAVQMELSRVVSSPVPCAFLPSSRTNRVRVTTLVSKAALSDMLCAVAHLTAGKKPGGGDDGDLDLAKVR